MSSRMTMACVALLFLILCPATLSAEKIKLVAFDAASSNVADIKAIAAFTAKTGIEVEVLAAPWTQWEEKVPVMLATGQQLDLIRFDQVHAATAVRENWLVPLLPYINRDQVDLSVYPQPVVWYPPYDSIGEIFTITYTMSANIMIYDRQLLAGSGVAFPSTQYGHADTKWGNWVEMSKKLMASSHDGQITRWGTNFYATGTDLLAAFDVDWVDKDVSRFRGADPDLVSAYTTIANLFNVDRIAKLSTGTVLAGTAATQILQTGSWLVSVDPTKIDLGIAPVPWAVKPGVQAGLNSWGIARTSKHAEAAWEFIKYFTYGDGILSWMDNVTLSPVTNRRYGKAWIERLQSHMPNADLSVVLNSGNYYWGTRSYLSPGWPEANVLLNKALASIVAGEKSTTVAMNEIKSPIDAILQRNPFSYTKK